MASASGSMAAARSRKKVGVSWWWCGGWGVVLDRRWPKTFLSLEGAPDIVMGLR